MSPLSRLARVRRTVSAALSVRIVMIALAAGAALLLLALGLDAALSLPRLIRGALTVVAALVSVGIALRLAVRGWRVRSDETLALWIETHYPLDYLLVTAADHRFADDARLAEELTGRSFEPVARRVAWSGVGAPAVAAILLTAGLLVVPAPRLARVMRPRTGDVLNVAHGRGASRLRPIVVRYTAPAYVGGETVTLEDPTAVRGLEGGRVELAGLGAGAGLTALLGARVLPAADSGVQWHVVFQMPRAPVVVRLRGDSDERLVALEPVPDSLPAVVLRAPARDTVVRVATGLLRLEAIATDDHGLSSGWFEYILSSGTGELFQFRTGIIGRRVATGRADSLTGTVDLTALDLKAGDVLHLRAVASDRGPVARGMGSSDTRTLRVARAGESESSAVVVMPPLLSDTAALSQRLLIQLAEALEARRARLARGTVVGESQSIGRDQARLRRQVADVIFLRLSGEVEGEHAHGLEDDTLANLSPEELLQRAEAATNPDPEQRLDFHEDESPVVAVNRPLLEAYNAMWDATRELDVGEPGRALPHMRLALEAIQRSRAAERVYLRGASPRVVVNLQQVRLSGKLEDVVTQPRVAGPPGPQATMLERLLWDLSLLSTDREAARDSLLVLRVELLTEAPMAAAFLGEAIAALRADRDPVRALAAARGALGGSPAARAGIAAWAAGGNW